MKKVLVPLADGFEEIEAITVIDVLRRAGFSVTVAGLKAGAVTGSRKLAVLPDAALDAVLAADYDMVVFPGGQPGTDHLRKDERILGIARKMDEKKKWIGAICAAPLVIRDAGIATGCKLTSYPGVEEELKGYVYVRERVVVDGKIVTSRGPGAAMEFALKLVELLESPSKAEGLAAQMVVREGA